MKKIRCAICGTWYEVTKDKTYIVVGDKLHISYDAIDCPVCGCQDILAERRRRLDDAQGISGDINRSGILVRSVPL